MEVKWKHERQYRCEKACEIFLTKNSLENDDIKIESVEDTGFLMYFERFSLPCIIRIIVSPGPQFLGEIFANV